MLFLNQIKGVPRRGLIIFLEMLFLAVKYQINLILICVIIPTLHYSYLLQFLYCININNYKNIALIYVFFKILSL